MPKMTAADMASRENIVKSMKKNIGDFRKRYGKRAKEVMYATATKMAMEEEQIIFEADENDGHAHEYLSAPYSSSGTCRHCGKKKVFFEPKLKPKHILHKVADAAKKNVKEESLSEDNPEWRAKLKKDRDAYWTPERLKAAHEKSNSPEEIAKRKKSLADMEARARKVQAEIDAARKKYKGDVKEACMYRKKKVVKENKYSLPAGSMKPKTPIKQKSSLEKRFGHLNPGESAPLKGNPQKVVKEYNNPDDYDVYDRRFKSAELAHELRHEDEAYWKAQNQKKKYSSRPKPVEKKEPHAVHINGKKWKTFSSHGHATNVGKKISAKDSSKKVTIHKEEVEQIDELSKSTLGSYIKRASSSAAGHHGAEVDANRDSKAYGEHTPEKRNAKARQMYHGDKSAKRLKGVRRATDKLTKEGVEYIELDMDNLSRSATAHMREDDGPHTTKLTDTDTPNFETVVGSETAVNQPNSKGNVDSTMKTAPRMSGKPFKAFRGKAITGPVVEMEEVNLDEGEMSPEMKSKMKYAPKAASASPNKGVSYAGKYTKGVKFSEPNKDMPDHDRVSTFRRVKKSENK